MAKKKVEKNEQIKPEEGSKATPEVEAKVEQTHKAQHKTSSARAQKNKVAPKASEPEPAPAPQPIKKIESKTSMKPKTKPTKVEEPKVEKSKPESKIEVPAPKNKRTRATKSKEIAELKEKLQIKEQNQENKIEIPVQSIPEQLKQQSTKQAKEVKLKHKPEAKKFEEKPVQIEEPILTPEQLGTLKTKEPISPKETTNHPSPSPNIAGTLKKNANTKKTTEEEEEAEPKAPNVRYTDEELEMFEKVITEAKRESLEELRMLKERLEDLNTFDLAEESMFYSMHMGEQGSEPMEKEKTYAQIQRINEYIKKLDEALQRIKNKTYGICRMCGILIAKERLLAVPITTLSASWKIHQRCPEDGIDRIEDRKSVV
jgi:DnaK suppressor protein